MVTDEEFKRMEERVQKLEKQIQVLQLTCAGNAMRTTEPGHIHQDKVKRRDITKYVFEGEVYCKRMIVRKIVQRTVQDRHIDSIEAIKEIFPDGIQGALGVVKSAEWAEKYAEADKRFFFKDEDVIILQGRPFVICSQWDVKNISKFLKVAEKLGYNIKSVNYSEV